MDAMVSGVGEMKKKRRESERGQVLLLFVAFSTVLIVFAAIAIDQGLWLGHRRVAQKDADAAARAGAAQYIKALSANQPASSAYDAAGAAALDLATQNGAPTVTAAADFSPAACANGTNTDQTCARPDCPTIDPSDPSQPGTPIADVPSIEIAVPRPAPALFLRAFGVGDANTIGARSTACVGSPSEIVPGPVSVLPLMVHYGDPESPDNPIPCFSEIVPKLGSQCILNYSHTSEMFAPDPLADPPVCEPSGPSPTGDVTGYLETGFVGFDFKCAINPCIDTVDPVALQCLPVGSACPSEPQNDCIWEKSGNLGSNDVDALSQRLIDGETGAGKCWLRSDGNSALDAFKAAFAREDGEPVGGPPGIGGTDTGNPVYVQKQCDTGRVVFVFITERAHDSNGTKEYPILGFAFVYLVACYKSVDYPLPLPDEISWCDGINGNQTYLQGVPLRVFLTGSIGGIIRPPTPGQPLIIQTTR
jgi:hypothetical protein